MADDAGSLTTDEPKKPTGFLWVNLGLVGMGALGTPIAVGIMLWSLLLYFTNIGDFLPQLGATGSNTALANEGACQELANATLKDGRNLLDLLNAAAEYTGVEPAMLAAIASNESSLGQFLESPDFGYGIMQTQLETYNDYKRKTDPRQEYVIVEQNGYEYYKAVGTNHIVENSEAAVFAGANYYKTQLDHYKDPYWAAAAYNAGPGNVDRWRKVDSSPFNVKMFKVTEEYIRKFKTAYEKYKGCQEADTLAGNTGLSATAQKLVNYVRAHPNESNQFLNGEGRCGCARTVIRVLEDAFPGSKGGEGGWISTGQVGKAPTDQEMKDAQDILSTGKLPVWHIRGSGSGQHWIVLVQINGNEITFFDPAQGAIVTESRNLKSTAVGYPGEFYFGITEQEGGDDSDLKRGYTFSPR